MEPSSKKRIPNYSFNKDDHTSIPFLFLELKYRDKPLPFNPHRHNFFELFFFIEGAGYHLLDFEKFPILNSSVHFVAPGQLHAVQRDLQSSGYAILFSRDFYHLHLEDKGILMRLPLFDLTQNQVIDIPENSFKELKGIFELMQYEYKKELKEEGVLRSLLHIILSKILISWKSKQQPTEEKPDTDSKHLHIVNQFKKLVEEKFVELHQVNDFAALMSISPNHLNTIVKKRLGLTASELIQNRLILEAKRLLMHSDLSNKEVAYSLNFKDPAYFSRFFRKHTQQSPTGFKRLILEKYQH